MLTFAAKFSKKNLYIWENKTQYLNIRIYKKLLKCPHQNHYGKNA